MRILSYTPHGRMKVGGHYSWDDLYIPRKGNDLRFRFRVNHTDKLNYGFLMDFDNLPKHEGENLLDMAWEVFGDIRMYSVFTGRGYHIYIPVDEGIGRDDYANYKTSYKTKMEEFVQWLPGSCKLDPQPFTFHATGRVPGSVNTKSGETIEVVDEHPGAVVNSLGDIFDYEDAPLRRITPVLPDKSSYRPDKYCPFVMAVLADDEVASEYEMWKTAAGILVRAGRENVARELTERTERPMQEVEGLIQRKDTHNYTCKTIREGQGAKLKENPCEGCLHGRHYCQPAFVSGPLPTPMAPQGFHPLTAEGVLNSENVHIFSILNHWTNRHREKRIIVGGKLYDWDGTAFAEMGDLELAAKFPYEVTKELRDIPLYGVRGIHHMAGLRRAIMTDADLPRPTLEECDDERYINLSNGVYNMETHTLEEHHPKYLMINKADMNYSPGAECPRFYKFLDEVVPDVDDQGLLQVFFGLALSNISCEEHEQALWMYGNSGTGKTTLYRLMEMLLGGKMIKEGRGSLMFKEGGLTFDTTGRSCVFIEDVKPDNKLWADVEAFLTGYLSTSSVSVRMMYKDKFHVRPKGALIFTANDAPEFVSTQDGGFRRLRTLQFWRQPADRDTRLIHKLREEKDGIFLWALEGLKYYQQHGIPPLSAREKEEREERMETVEDTLEVWAGKMTYDINGQVPWDTAYHSYLRWSGESPETYSKGRFSKRLRKYLPGVLQQPAGDIFRRGNGRYLRVQLPEQKRR